MVDQTLIDASRDYDCCRYFDLIKRIEEFYADGQITTDELKQMGDMRGETLINYQVALGMLQKMDPKAKDYEKLVELADYLRRCWQMMDYAYDKGVLVNQQEQKAEEVYPSMKPKKRIILNVDVEKAALLQSVSTPAGRRKEGMKRIDSDLDKISPAEKEKATLRVLKAMEILDQNQIHAARLKLMGMEHTK